jgi:hypothetical protein
LAEKLTLFVQGGFCMPGCCGVTALRSTDGEPLFSRPGEHAEKLSGLLVELRARFGGRLEISVENSWGFFALWSVLRLGITPSKPTWVMNGKKLFEGVPDVEYLVSAVEREITAPLS